MPKAYAAKGEVDLTSRNGRCPGIPDWQSSVAMTTGGGGGLAAAENHAQVMQCHTNMPRYCNVTQNVGIALASERQV